jgi:putative endonuclease
MTLARKATGTWGEDLAAEHLQGLGYTLMDRNVRFEIGELDIVAIDGDTLVFVEVKAFERLSPGADPAENVHRAKQQRIGRCALMYLTRYKREPICRFDVVTVVRAPVFRLQHFKGAFTL